MESVFCFEIAIDVLQLRKTIKCDVPFISIAFLNFSTIVIKLKQMKHEKSNRYLFHNGKSCLFKISPTELYKKLVSTPIYIFVFDQKYNCNIDANPNQQTCIGTTSIDMSNVIKHVIEEIQNCGLCQAASHCDSVCVPILNNLQDPVGYIDVAYKLTCLGHTMLPHLKKCVTHNNGNAILDDSSFILNSNSPAIKTYDDHDNVECPPALYFKAKRKLQVNCDSQDVDCDEPDKSQDISAVQSSQTAFPISVKEKRKSVVLEWQKHMKSFIQMKPLTGQKSESTQTDLEHLNQYPVLKALISEVVELGLNKPSLSPQLQDSELLVKRKSPTPVRKKFVSPIKVAKPLKPLAEKNYSKRNNSALKVSSTKKHSMSYGLTKTHLLRFSLNRQSNLSATYTKPLEKKAVKHPKKLPTKQLSIKKKYYRSVNTFTQTFRDDFEDAEVVSQSISTDIVSTELRFGSVKDTEELSPDKSSPRVMSRQSIEVHLPSAITQKSYSSSEELSTSYKYSDDFDDGQTTFKSTSISSSSFHKSTYTSTSTKEETQRELSTKVSSHSLSQTTSPDRSVVLSAPPRKDSFQQDQPNESFALTSSDYNETTVASSPNIDTKYAEPVSEIKSFASKLSTEETDEFTKDSYNSRPTDDSKPNTDSLASMLTTVPSSKKLPIPAPSSDSPIIRSLASEPRNRKPRPPTVSQSSSMERLKRKFRRSTETSFQISDPSDVHSSDLVDLRTSELSDLRSTDENISPIHSVDVTNLSSSLPNVTRKK